MHTEWQLIVFHDTFSILDCYTDSDKPVRLTVSPHKHKGRECTLIVSPDKQVAEKVALLVVECLADERHAALAV